MQAGTWAERMRERKVPEALLGALSFLVLFLTLFYAYSQIRRPTFDLHFHPHTWEVLHGRDGCSSVASDCLRPGDQLLALDGVERATYLADRTVEIFTRRDRVQVEARRGDQRLSIELQARPRKPPETVESVMLVVFPLVFWTMGTVAVLFLRPRGERWLVLVLFQYAAALLFAAGSASLTRTGYSSSVFHLVVWLFLPISLHLHLILPTSPWRRWHGTILPIAYGASAALIVWDLVSQLGSAVFLPWCAAALLLSLGLLSVRLFLPAPTAVRVASRLMCVGLALGIGVALGPWLTVIWLLSGQIPDGLLPAPVYSVLAGVVATLALPLWPVSYIYAIYKYNLGSIELRANRLLGVYGFLTLYMSCYLVVFMVVGRYLPSVTGNPVLATLVLSSLFVTLAPFLSRRFQLLIDRTIFGIRYTLDEVLSTFAARLPGALERPALCDVIVGEILPTLQIRRSALYLLIDGEIETFYEQETPPGFGVTGSEDLDALLARTGEFIRTWEDADERVAWIRLILPVAIEGERIGAWVFGRRDPDDYYPRGDVELLSLLSNQIAAVIRLQQELAQKRSLQQQLVHSQKMKALGHLSAGVAHDFNNMLSAILSYSDLLETRLGSDEVCRRYLRGILDSGEKAAALARRLLTFARPQPVEVRAVQVNDAVTELESLIDNLLPEDVEAVFALGTALPSIRIDPGQLQQVILNLASNAVDAMPEGGRLTIETTAVEVPAGGTLGGHLAGAELAPGRYVVLRVRDTGTGIDPEVQARIFDPFFTTKELGKGTGLGLSIVYGVVDQAGGHVAAESIVGRGTTFSVFLPAVDQGAGEERGSRPREAAAAAGLETILLAEDEEVVRLVASEILQLSGYTVLEAADGVEALAVYERHAGVIAMVLTDVRMPRMRGPELAGKLRQLDPTLKVLFMSGYSEEAFAELETGAADFELISKPFMPHELTRKVREVLDAE